MSGPAAAQEDLATDPTPVLTCLAEADRDPAAERACAGAEALVCIDALGDAAEPAGLAACHAAEAAAWEGAIAALTGEIATLLSLQAEAGAEQATLLDEAQTAWRDFREADCAQEAAHWGAEPMGDAALSQCWLNRSAGRALELLAKRRILENP